MPHGVDNGVSNPANAVSEGPDCVLSESYGLPHGRSDGLLADLYRLSATVADAVPERQPDGMRDGPHILPQVPDSVRPRADVLHAGLYPVSAAVADRVPNGQPDGMRDAADVLPD